MATPRLFRLKAEVAPASSGPQALVLPIARVRVDTGVFHLDQVYDYLVPERLSEDLQIGVRVQVPFGNRETEGIVVERVSRPLITGEIKKISKVISRNQVATSHSLQIYDEVAKIYGCNPWDIIRSAIPPRVASVDKEIYVSESATSRIGKASSVFFTFAPYSSPESQIAVQAKEYLKFGSVLIVAPDENDVANIVTNLENLGIHALKLTAALSREERYLNYLKSLKGAVQVVVGTRSSIFLPLKDLATIMIFKESSFDHYEVRSPGWNSRIVAETRARLENLNLILSGYSPSSDVALQIDSKKIKYINARTDVSVAAFSPVSGTLLPGRIFADIRNALRSGPVLFLVPRKGYGNALMCSHCKNIALCNCGGRLAVASKNVSPHCVHCGLIYKNWRCNFCNHEKQYLLSRGLDRASEEISRAFPGFPVIISNADIIKREVENRPSLVFSTPGAQPRVTGGYAAVVVLDGTRFFSHTDFRASERGREIFFETSAMLSPTGKAFS